MDAIFTNTLKLFPIFARICPLFWFAPIFGAPAIPITIRSIISFWVSLAIFPSVHPFINPPLHSFGAYTFYLLGETLIGILIALFFTIITMIFQLSGQFYTFQMGLGIIEVLDPLAELQVPIIGQLLALVGFLLFLIIDGPQLLLFSLCKSYSLLPHLKMVSLKKIAPFIIETFCNAFFVALKIALPVMATAVLVDTAMGILARVAPQMHVMLFGWPLKIAVGMLTLILLASALCSVGKDAIFEGFKKIEYLLRSL